MAAMTPTRPISAQRHSPEVTGDAARSADDIFLIRERKRSMSDKPDLAVELGDLSFNKQGGKFFRADERLSGRPPSGSRSSGTRAASKIPAPVGCRSASKPTRAPELFSAALRSASCGAWRLRHRRIPGFSASSRRSRRSRSDSCRA